MIRLMNLPASVQRSVATGLISAGHARALLGLSSSQEIEALAKRIISQGLSVRTVEEIIASASPSKNAKKKAKKNSTPVEFSEIAERIGDALDTRATIEGTPAKGKILIEYAGIEDLQRITTAIEG
jgi:ParB family chromosome partitioning protein